MEGGNGSKSGVVKLALEAGNDFRIRNRKWENQRIEGPAVCAVISGLKMQDCTFEETAEMVFWVRPKHVVIGLIGLENVEFQSCYFRGVAFVGSEDAVRQGRASLTS